MTLADMPALNAGLNAASFCLLLAGFFFVRARRLSAHRNCMLAALACSTVFLACYLVYHARVGSVRFTGQGPIRALYFSVLATHTVLAALIVPLVLVTLVRALRSSFEAHRRIARLTLPLWAYVSITGVVVYWMLYRL